MSNVTHEQLSRWRQLLDRTSGRTEEDRAILALLRREVLESWLEEIRDLSREERAKLAPAAYERSRSLEECAGEERANR